MFDVHNIAYQYSDTSKIIKLEFKRQNSIWTVRFNDMNMSDLKNNGNDNFDLGKNPISLSLRKNCSPNFSRINETLKKVKNMRDLENELIDMSWYEK